MTTFVEGYRRNGMVIVDGYSSAKSVRAALADFGRYISRIYSKPEGELLTNVTEQDLQDGFLNVLNIPGEWYCEVQEVPCASQYNEETDEVEYKDGYNYYVYVRFVA